MEIYRVEVYFENLPYDKLTGNDIVALKENKSFIEIKSASGNKTMFKKKYIKLIIITKIGE